MFGAQTCLKDFLDLEYIVDLIFNLNDFKTILIKSDKNVNIQDVILNWTKKIKTPNNVKLTIDIDPFSFM